MQLPLIEQASSLFDDDNLQNCYIIGVQHILPSTYTMFKSLFKKGLNKNNLSLLGKCYSTDLETFEQMKKDGIDVSELSIKFDSHEEYDSTFKNKIKKFLETRKHILKQQYKKIIILDDGGDLLSIISNYLDENHNIVCMEQTSSGYNSLKNVDLKLPVINLARSKAKLVFEPNRIILNALRKIFYHIEKLNVKISKILILGNGEIGSFLFETLKNSYTVTKYDKVKQRSDLNRTELISEISQSDMIIGCSGATSLPRELHTHVKEKTILVSLSSSDREFDAVHLRNKETKITTPWQTLNCNGIYLLNCGFPISFDNNDADDSYFFQYIRSLIMSSIYQALNTDSSKKGFIELDEKLQNQMMKQFKEYQEKYQI